ncbi:MAG: hypothetical protein VX726_05635 [Planctomycetota bacterium]|nr:hypothetical protein [Planctomycetota bacterium]MEE2895208.1 hypothetical protein [Planctomycetota bacterium]
MLEGGISNSGAIPYLKRMMQFSWQRNALLADAAANIDDPDYRRRDVPVAEFQEAMKSAWERENRLPTAARMPPLGGGHGPFADTEGIRFTADGIRLDPAERNDFVQHDGNDRNLERVMQDLAENALAFRLASELFRKEHDILRSAIRERP